MLYTETYFLLAVSCRQAPIEKKISSVADMKETYSEYFSLLARLARPMNAGPFPYTWWIEDFILYVYILN